MNPCDFSLQYNFLILENTSIYSKELFFRHTREDGLIVSTYLFVSCEFYGFGTYVYIRVFWLLFTDLRSSLSIFSRVEIPDMLHVTTVQSDGTVCGLIVWS